MKLESILFKTWIEIKKTALKHNIYLVKKLLKSPAKLWFVVKSNAYGHGLVTAARLGNKFGVDGFCVDSVLEGQKLRKVGIVKPILVLGPTLPNLYKTAKKYKITISISHLEFLNALSRSSYRPDFHLKIDTRMHRQGFYNKALPHIIKVLKQHNLLSNLKGVFTHFASAKDPNYPSYTEFQFQKFQKSLVILKAQKGIDKNLFAHCAASGATLINSKYHLDAVRVGMVLYGLWPAKEMEVQMGNRLDLKPVLSWKSIISEIKKGESGDFIGYDLTEKLTQDTNLGIIPIGYWHGYDRALSSKGAVLVNGHQARVLGRVSMDLLVVDLGSILCKVGDPVVLIGKNKNSAITANTLADWTNTTAYEVLARINPLIERVEI